MHPRAFRQIIALLKNSGPADDSCLVWLILPVGHDQGIRHFPWVTAGIAALCLLVQTQRSLSGPSDQELFAASEETAALEQELVGPAG
jgi:hypothetical protein